MHRFPAHNEKLIIMATSNQWWTEMSNKCVCWPVPSFIHQIKTRLDQHFSSFRAQMERNQLRPHLQFKSSSSLGKSSDQYELKQFKWIDSIEFPKKEKRNKSVWQVDANGRHGDTDVDQWDCLSMQSANDKSTCPQVVDWD